MQHRFRILALFLFLLFLNVTVLAQTVTRTVIAPIGWQQNGLEFRIRDYLNHPKMNWPATHISYPIDLSADAIRADQLELVDEANSKQIRMQLSGIEEKNGLLQKAHLHFIAGLKAGEDQVYLLRKRMNPADKPESSAVKVAKSEGLIELNNDVIKVAIPESGKLNLPPIAQLGDKDGWYGKGMFGKGLAAEKLTVTEGSIGPVFAEYHLDYNFKSCKSYKATVRVVAGMEFFELEEEMKGFNTADSLVWRIVWDQLKPDFRFCPNRPGGAIDPKNTGFNNFDWEPIAGNGGDPKAVKHPLLPHDQQSRPGGRLPFQLVPYDNWLSWWNLPTATFWDQSKNKSVGIFIKDLEKWDDGDYALWGSTQKLSIYFNWNSPQLSWTFPLIKGTRSIGISIYSHQKDVDLVSETNVPLLHTDYLRRWYGWISLDKVKNWQLDYDQKEATTPLFFSSESKKPELDVAELEKALENKLANISENSERNNGPTPVGSRDFNEKIVPLWFANYQYLPTKK